MRTKMVAKVLLAIATCLTVTACLAWQLIGYALREFAQGGVCREAWSNRQ